MLELIVPKQMGIKNQLMITIELLKIIQLQDLRKYLPLLKHVPTCFTVTRIPSFVNTANRGINIVTIATGLKPIILMLIKLKIAFLMSSQITHGRFRMTTK